MATHRTKNGKSFVIANYAKEEIKIEICPVEKQCHFLVSAINNCYHVFMKAKHRKILAAIFADPFNGNMKWADIEALLIAPGCQAIKGADSSVTFERDSIRVYFHSPHPEKKALWYRVKDAREFITWIGEAP